MKFLLLICRWFVGVLFIFSGLVKANDPLGLSYKMQEFFEAWSLNGFHTYTLALSLLMNTFEIIAGVAVIIGWRMRLFSWLLLLLILFFTFLTGYASLATNVDGTMKFRSCGCFGDCLPLSPNQSFFKDLVLLVFIGFIFYFRNLIKPLFAKASINLLLIIGAAIFAIVLQWYVLNYLPIVDCLPFKKGSNLIENRKIPANAITDKFEYKFIYEKNGEKKEFSLNALPDSTWKFADRKQILIRKGSNNEAKIKDFDLKTSEGFDLTDSILNQSGIYYLLFIKDVAGLKSSDAWVKVASKLSATKNLIIITGQFDALKELLKNDALLKDKTILVSDVTAIKTAARVVPTLFKMNGPVVMGKWSVANFDLNE